MNIVRKDISDKEVLNSFVESSVNGNFMQSWQWSKYQEEGLGKKVDRHAFYDGEELVAVAICYEVSQSFGKYMYCMRGPILKFWDEGLYEGVLKELVTFYMGSEYVFVKIDPAIEESNDISVNPLSLGFKKCINYVQPETPFFQDLVEGGEEELLAWCKERGMSKNYRTYIRKARKEGLSVRFSNDVGDWEYFTEYLSRSADSKEFVIHNPDYYLKQLEYMGEDDLVRLAIVELNGEPIAMLILSYFAGEVSCLYSAQTGLHTKMRGPLFMRWECMLDAQRRGFKRFNSWNVLDGKKYNPKSAQYGYSHFKRSFGGYVVKYQRTMDYPLNGFKYLLVRFLDLYRRLRFYNDR